MNRVQILLEETWDVFLWIHQGCLHGEDHQRTKK
jgi:hypothetical protein